MAAAKFCVVAFGLSAVLGACSSSPAPSGASATIDTIAGVVRVMNLGSGSIDTASVLVSLGSEGGGNIPAPDEFGRIQSIALDAVGNVLIADGLASEVRVFSPEGEFLRRFGRSGQGPGEFPHLYSLGWIGESLLTLELARLSVFGEDGQFLRHYPWLPFTGPSSVVRFYTTGHEEVYVMGRMPPGTSGSGFIRFTTEGAQDTLHVVMSEPAPVAALVCPHSGGILSIFDIPFAARRIITPAPHGQVALATSDAYRIVLRSSSGDTLRVIEREYAALPVNDDEWEQATEEYEQFRNDNPGIQCEPTGMPRVRMKPALQGLYFGYEGQLIVEVTAEGASLYDFFDHDGIVYATVVAPARDPGVVPVFRGDKMAQVVRDELGIQRVQVFRVTPAPERQSVPGA